MSVGVSGEGSKGAAVGAGGGSAEVCAGRAAAGGEAPGGEVRAGVGGDVALGAAWGVV